MDDYNKKINNDFLKINSLKIKHNSNSTSPHNIGLENDDNSRYSSTVLADLFDINSLKNKDDNSIKNQQSMMFKNKLKNVNF